MAYIEKHSFIALLLFLSFLSCADVKTEGLNSSQFQDKELTTEFEFSEPEGIFFQIISDVKRNSEGMIFVQDFRHKGLLAFDQNGTFHQAIGKEGRGPGEFALIGGFFFSGDSLYILDRILQKLEVFTVSENKYTHLETRKLISENRTGKPITINSKGIIIQNFPIYNATVLNHRSDMIFSLVSKEGVELIDTLFSFPGNQPLVKRSGELLSANKPLGVKSYVSPAFNGGVFATQSDSLLVHYFDFQGNKNRSFYHKILPRPISSQYKDSLLGTLSGSKKTALRQQFPDHFPMINDLIVDNKDRIWVELNSENLNNGWYVFSKIGSPLFKLPKPHASAELYSIYNNNIIWSYSDKTGAPILVYSSFN